MDNRIGVGRGIGKIILMGEHSVVYGEPALAIPFPVTRIESIVKESEGPISLNCFFHQGPLSRASERLAGLRVLVEQVVDSFAVGLKDFSIHIMSSIPPERGMGSSAAVAIATTRALYDYFKVPLTDDILFKWANVSERIVHGNPSGVDMAIIAGEVPLYYIKGRPFEAFPFKLEAHLIVGDTGKLGQTKAAVADVREMMTSNPQRTQPLISQLGILTQKARDAIEDDDGIELGRIMTEGHDLLKELSVSNESLDLLVSTALNHGALGAKLTGGGRGGCMIALASTIDQAHTICNGLLSNGAKETWILDMGVDLG